MSIAVIPAYKVIAKSARQVLGLPFEEAVDKLEEGLRSYIRDLLSNLHTSFVDLGERSAVAQLGDPNPEELLDALSALESGEPKGIVEDALALCVKHMPRSDLDARVVLLPGDGNSTVLVNKLNGALGFSLGAQVMMVFLWPTDSWQTWLRHTVTHEYAHLVRNLLFPRGLAGGKLIYLKTQEPETLLDALVAEGLADTFAKQVLPDISPLWTEAPFDDREAIVWRRVHRRLGVSEPIEIRRILFGDNDRIPQWAGYSYGYRIVGDFLEANPGTDIAELMDLPAKAIYEGSGFQARQESAL
ncbi:MAG: hypothetical protein IIC21_10570 [Chloroflexi bacterium]|nr:hypothetical protein [Chloroflexota bacterium]